MGASKMAPGSPHAFPPLKNVSISDILEHSTSPENSMRNQHITLDVESSGLSDDSYPISIGVVSNGQAWSWMICPLEDWVYWDEFSEERHGLTRDQLIEQGRDAYLVCREMNAIFEGMSLIVDSTWDKFWVGRMFEDLGIKCSFSIRGLEECFNRETVARIYEEIELLEWPHVAIQDARILYDLIEQIVPVRLPLQS